MVQDGRFPERDPMSARSGLGHGFAFDLSGARSASGRDATFATSLAKVRMWGGKAVQIVPWTLIDGSGTAAQFAEVLRRQPIRRISFTSISNALSFGRKLFQTSRFRGSRRVIDVSGDGPNNAGVPVPVARNTTIAQGIVVDGLPIMLKTAPDSASIPDLDVYYEECVIGGDGAFVLKVSDVTQFADAILNKLILEISGRKLSGLRQRQMGLTRAEYTRPYNCFVGEELQERSIGNSSTRFVGRQTLADWKTISSRYL